MDAAIVNNPFKENFDEKKKNKQTNNECFYSFFHFS